jgi:hypothetical protein
MLSSIHCSIGRIPARASILRDGLPPDRFRPWVGCAGAYRPPPGCGEYRADRKRLSRGKTPHSLRLTVVPEGRRLCPPAAGAAKEPGLGSTAPGWWFASEMRRGLAGDLESPSIASEPLPTPPSSGCYGAGGSPVGTARWSCLGPRHGRPGTRVAPLQVKLVKDVPYYHRG